MKALTVRQPWASLIAMGVKRLETRSWSTTYRGPLMIHAGKAWAPGWLAWMHEDDDRLELLDSAGGCSDEDTNGSGYFRPWAKSLPLGAVVAVADLVDVVPITDALGGCKDETAHLCVLNRSALLHSPFAEPWPDGATEHIVSDQLPLGDFTPGGYAWLLGDVRPIDPVPAKGRQGLWTPDDALLAAVVAGGGT